MDMIKSAKEGGIPAAIATVVGLVFMFWFPEIEPAKQIAVNGAAILFLTPAVTFGMKLWNRAGIKKVEEMVGADLDDDGFIGKKDVK